MGTLLGSSYDALLAEMGASQLLAYARNETSKVMSSDPAAGLVMIEKVAPLMTRGESPHEAERQQLWGTQLRLLRRYLSFAGQTEFRPAGLPAERTAPMREAAAHLRTALDAGERDREPDGLVAVAQAVAALPALQEVFVDAMDYLRSSLYKGAGVVAFRQSPTDAVTAARCYGEALALTLRLGSTRHALELLDNIRDVADLGDPRAERLVIDALIALATSIETLLSDNGARSVQAIGATLIQAWSLHGRLRDELAGGALFDLLRVLKGRRLAAALAGHVRHDWQADPETSRRLDDIEAVRQRAIPREGDPDRALPGDLDHRLMGPIGNRDKQEGRDGRERFENLRYGFDRYLNRRILASAISPIGPTPSVEHLDLDPPGLRPSIADVQDRLDDETVLLDLLVTDYGPTQQTVLVLAITPDNAEVAVAMHTTPPDAPASDLTALGDFVVDLRRAAQAGSAVASGETVFGPMADWLEADRQTHGRSHLCIVPHRELHYLPFHLLSLDGRALADDWTVTLLPNLQLLFTDVAPAKAPAHAMTAVGVSFEADDPRGLPVLQQSGTSARGVAQLFDETPLTGAAATDANVLDALADSRLAYVYTHGLQCAYAPAFHRLCCAVRNGQATDIDAYEILGRDLRGLEVLGAAACESVLGRFDLSDNLTGLPASFFQAGVRTIVGALWEVRADVADYFFLMFFLAMLDHAPRREAFVRAQRDTKTAYPDAMDWGAFCFLGA